MNGLHFMLAEMDAKDLLEAQKGTSDYSWLIMMGALFVVIGGATVWAVIYSQKKKKRKSRHQRHRELPNEVAPAPSDDGEPQTQSQEGEEMAQAARPHRPLNPTLAQTRGLPPMRDENTPLPPMP